MGLQHRPLLERSPTLTQRLDQARRLGSTLQRTTTVPGQTGRVQFSADLRDRVADGTITVSYRLWSRPKVKVGGVYRSGSVMIEVEDIELVPFSSITDHDLAQTGEADIDGLRHRAAHAGPIKDDTVVFRVQFHVVRPAGDALA